MCERNYTPATIAEMQRIALIAELRKQMLCLFSGGSEDDNSYDAGHADGWNNAINRCIELLDELAPVCDDPESPTLVDITEGMTHEIDE